jgi:UDP-N-acetylmuramyl tripeptide synthase
VIVTGTNGKTTTARLLASVLEDSGYTLVHNRSGANLIYGLATAFLESGGRGKSADIALMEVDEATVPEAVRQLRPLGVVVTNFFRDQLDRYGELDTTVSMVARGLDAMRGRGFIALNADDPLVASLGRGRSGRVVHYGIDDLTCGRKDLSETREQRQCLVCGSELSYDIFFYGHLGRYACPACDFHRPEVAVRGGNVDLLGTRGSRVAVTSAEGEEARVKLNVPGLYNVYNGLAALTAALELGIPLGKAAAAIGRAPASFGRMERIEVEGRSVLLALVKNPAGFNQVLRTLLEDDGPGGPRPAPGKQFLIAINDRYADGTDVSWLWDVDFEVLSRPEAGVAGIVVSGIRAHDMAVRLKYAGVRPGLVKCVPAPAQALELALSATSPGDTLYMTPTYTAMLELRDIISRLGYAQQYWESDPS